MNNKFRGYLNISISEYIIFRIFVGKLFKATLLDIFEKMVSISEYFGVVLVMALLAVSVNALADPFDDTRKQRLEFGHSLLIENIQSGPISPGSMGILNLTIKNDADFYLKDIRIKVNLPSSISFINDVSARQISSLESKEKMDLSFSLIASPSAAEGIYQGTIITYYLNNMGTERSENYTFAVIVKGVPAIFAKLEDSEFYKGEEIGELTVTIINNGPANIKFLTAELQDSPDYEAIGAKKQYVGDLDSDDFESITFKLKILNDKDEIALPLKVSYKDSMNEDYSESMSLSLKMLSQKESGIKSNNTVWIIIAVIAALCIAYIIYRLYKKKKNHCAAKDGFVMPMIPRDIRKRKKL